MFSELYIVHFNHFSVGYQDMVISEQVGAVIMELLKKIS